MSSSRISWSTSSALSRTDSDEDVEAKFEKPEFFHRTTKGGWYCSACAPSGDPNLHSFSAAAAMSHEQSINHKDKVTRLTDWNPPPGEDWGIYLHTPYDRLRESKVYRPVPLAKKVKRWIRDTARAEGIDFEVEEDLDESEDEEEQSWDDWFMPVKDWMPHSKDWASPIENTRRVDTIKTDPRAAADFRFVEKIAKKRGMTKDCRRLHAFYRLPTEQKVTRIQEIVRFIHSH